MIVHISPTADKQRQHLVDSGIRRTYQPESMTKNQHKERCDEIKQLLHDKNAVIVAHYYTDPAIQDIALATGGCVADSLAMARFSYEHKATTLMVAGVRFMGETAKILAPNKRVLMPTLDANCSLDIGCPIDDFKEFCQSYPDRKVVVYANTSAAVKAMADWVVTSSNAVDIVDYLDASGEKILWAPDKYLGDYVARKTGADLLSWNGSCVVHEEFKASGLKNMLHLYPEAKVLAHPEAPHEVLALADGIGSTAQIIDFAKIMPAEEFIVATDKALLYGLRQSLPHKSFIHAPTAGEGASCKSCARCPWMAMNGLQNLAHSLRHGDNEITLDAELINSARLPLERMINFVAKHKIPEATAASL